MDNNKINKNMEKSNINCYVLVPDVTSGLIHYYEGYFLEDFLTKKQMPVCTSEFTKALKNVFKEEAQYLCNEINKISNSKFHVEEHCYM